MQTSKEIARKIDQITREIADIERSLPVIYDRGTDTEQEDAEVSLVAHQNRLKRLQARLEDVRQEEHRQGEQAKREALEHQRDAAREQFDLLTERFETALGPLIDQINTALDDTLRPLSLDRDTESSSYSSACFELRGRTTDWSGANDLSTGFGFFDKTTREHQDVRNALFELYKARIGAGGSSFAGVAPRPPQYHDDTAQQAITDEVNRYFDRPGS